MHSIGLDKDVRKKRPRTCQPGRFKAQRRIMENRWSIWIDVEGFASLFKLNSGSAIRHLNYLMESLYKIGIHVFGRSPDRLFIHQ